MDKIFYFQCGNFEGRNFIYAVKFAENPWYYFDQIDSLSSGHDSLPAELNSAISALDIATLKTIKVSLNEEQARIYHVDGKFMFRNKELRTCKTSTLWFFYVLFFIDSIYSRFAIRQQTS